MTLFSVRSDIPYRVLNSAHIDARSAVKKHQVAALSQKGAIHDLEFQETDHPEDFCPWGDPESEFAWDKPHIHIQATAETEE